MSTKKESRRNFIKKAATATIGIPFIVNGIALGANGGTAASDRITIGIIGAGGRIRSVANDFIKEKDVQFLGVCDVRESHREMAKKMVDNKQGNQDCKMYRFHEDLLARKDIDAVLIGTGDRGHAILSAFAAAAGKDVYSEKPFSLTVGEGRAMVDIMKKYKRVWQCGTQRRSNPAYNFVAESVLMGKIGKFEKATAYLGNPWSSRTVIEKIITPPPAEEFDYERWLCQSPYEKYSEARVNKWRIIWATGGGVICDMGPHYFDAVQAACGMEKESPVEFSGTTTWPEEGIGETPVRLKVEAKYQNGVKLNIESGPKGIKFEGDGGWMHITDEAVITASSSYLLEGQPEGNYSWQFIKPHIRDFIDCIKKRDLNTASNPERTQRMHTICHSANLSLRLGRKLKWDYNNERFIDDAEANTYLNREMRKGWDIYKI